MTQILSGLGRFHPRGERDSQIWSRICAFVVAEPRAFSRDASIGGHITASAFVLSTDKSAVLLTHHKKLGLWLQLGGHCDGIADTGFVALKEAYEESGLIRIARVRDEILDVDIYDIPARKDEPAHLHYDVRFLFQAEAGEITVSDESHALAWVPLSNLESYTTEASILRMRDRV